MFSAMVFLTMSNVIGAWELIWLEKSISMTSTWPLESPSSWILGYDSSSLDFAEFSELVSDLDLVALTYPNPGSSSVAGDLWKTSL